MWTIMPSSSLFISILFMSTALVLSSPNWLFIWVGLEINLLSFIPLIMASSTRQETEAAIKYFVAQALGSSLILLSALTTHTMNMNPLFTQTISATLGVTGLLVKLGGAPLHMWFPQVMSSLSWPMCIILSTWQKVGPLMLLGMVAPQPWILYIAVASALTGGVGGLNQTQLRPLLAYSSIGHLGWMIAATLMNKNTLYSYFMIYIIISSSLMLVLSSMNSTTRTISSMKYMHRVQLMLMSLLLLSLAGMPPLTGFFPKWMVIQTLMVKSLYFLTIFLVAGALLNLFYYMSISMNAFMGGAWTHPSPNKTNTQLPLVASLLLINLSPILILTSYALTMLHKP